MLDEWTVIANEHDQKGWSVGEIGRRNEFAVKVGKLKPRCSTTQRDHE
jgi:hypothetical protein